MDKKKGMSGIKTKDPVGDGRKRTVFHGRMFYEYDGVVYEWLYKDSLTGETIFLDIEKDEEIRLKGIPAMMVVNQSQKSWREDYNIEKTEDGFLNHDTGEFRARSLSKVGGKGG